MYPKFANNSCIPYPLCEETACIIGLHRDPEVFIKSAVFLSYYPISTSLILSALVMTSIKGRCVSESISISILSESISPT